MKMFLILNGFEILADVDDQERFMLDLAAGNITRQELAAWLGDHVTRG